MILGAALLAAGVASSMAQSNVYSVNVVGYINVTCSNQFTVIANPLDFDGSGTNNLLTNVLNGVPAGTSIYLFQSGGFGIYTFNHGSWSSPPGFPNASVATLNPGQGVIVGPSASYLTANPGGFTLTMVGSVLQGGSTNSNISTGFSLLGSIPPISGAIDSTGNGGLGYVPVAKDQVYLWDNTLPTPGYDIYTFNHGTWAPSDPVIGVGQGFFLNTTNVAPTWVNTFTVQ